MSLVDFKYAGQNLAGRGSSAATEPAMTAIPSMINSWYNEYKYATPSQMEKLSNMNGKGGLVTVFYNETSIN